ALGIVRARSGSHPSPIGHLLRSGVQSRSRNMVSSEAKNGFNCVSCGTFQGARRGRASSAKREPRPNRRKGGVSGTLVGRGTEGSRPPYPSHIGLHEPDSSGMRGHGEQTNGGGRGPTVAYTARRRRLSSITRAPLPQGGWECQASVRRRRGMWRAQARNLRRRRRARRCFQVSTRKVKWVLNVLFPNPILGKGGDSVTVSLDCLIPRRLAGTRKS